MSVFALLGKNIGNDFHYTFIKSRGSDFSNFFRNRKIFLINTQVKTVNHAKMELIKDLRSSISSLYYWLNLPDMDILVGMEHPSLFHWKKVKVIINKNYSLVELVPPQLWLFVGHECQQMRSQIIGCHVHSNSVHAFRSKSLRKILIYTLLSLIFHYQRLTQPTRLFLWIILMTTSLSTQIPNPTGLIWWRDL